MGAGLKEAAVPIQEPWLPLQQGMRRRLLNPQPQDLVVRVPRGVAVARHDEREQQPPLLRALLSLVPSKGPWP